MNEPTPKTEPAAKTEADATTAPPSPPAVPMTEVAAVFIVGQPGGSLAFSMVDISGSKGNALTIARQMASYWRTMSMLSPEAHEHVSKALQHAVMMDHIKKTRFPIEPKPESDGRPEGQGNPSPASPPQQA